MLDDVSLYRDATAALRRQRSGGGVNARLVRRGMDGTGAGLGAVVGGILSRLPDVEVALSVLAADLAIDAFALVASGVRLGSKAGAEAVFAGTFSRAA